MTLKQWDDNGWLKEHQATAEEIGNLLAIVERDLKDASGRNISIDANELIEFEKGLKEEVEAWLENEHPELV